MNAQRVNGAMYPGDQTVLPRVMARARTCRSYNGVGEEHAEDARDSRGSRTAGAISAASCSLSWRAGPPGVWMASKKDGHSE